MMAMMIKKGLGMHGFPDYGKITLYDPLSGVKKEVVCKIVWKNDDGTVIIEVDELNNMMVIVPREMIKIMKCDMPPTTTWTLIEKATDVEILKIWTKMNYEIKYHDINKSGPINRIGMLPVVLR